MLHISWWWPAILIIAVIAIALTMLAVKFIDAKLKDHAEHMRIRSLPSPPTPKMAPRPRLEFRQRMPHPHGHPTFEELWAQRERSRAEQHHRHHRDPSDSSE